MEAAGSSDRSAPERGAAGWTSLLVLAMGVLASFALATAVRHAQEVELQREVESAAEVASRVVVSRLDDPLTALQAQIEIWTKDPPRTPALWIAEAERFLNDQPGFEALVRSTPDAGKIVAASGAGREMLAELGEVLDLEAAKAEPPRSRAGPHMIGPVRRAHGGTVIGFRLPLGSGRGGAVFLAVMDPERRLAPALADVAPRAALALEVQDLAVLELGKRAPDAARWTRELELRPSLGPSWSLRVEPTAEAVAESFTSAPGYALGACLLISLLLASVVHLGQLAATRARALRRANVRLEQRLAETSRAEGELHALNQTLEARVAERTRELRDAVLELETFVYSVSHDLRSPLGAIVNFAAILAEDYDHKLDGPGRDHLARISRSAQSAVAMMNALLAFSRTGRQEMHKSWIDVEALVQTVVAELSLSGCTPKPVLVFDRLPPAFADPSMLKLVFQNLLSNALKFAREGTQPRIEITAREDERECEYAVIDDGVGFDMRHAPKLFRVFERLHSAEDFPGHGVGLAIVARVVRRHGGWISAEGAPGKGATFRFTLPRA